MIPSPTFKWDSPIINQISKGLGFSPIILYLIETHESPEDNILAQRQTEGTGGFAERLVLSFPGGKIQQRLRLNWLTCSPVMQTDRTWQWLHEATTMRTEDRWTQRQIKEEWIDGWMIVTFIDWVSIFLKNIGFTKIQNLNLQYI